MDSPKVAPLSFLQNRRSSRRTVADFARVNIRPRGRNLLFLFAYQWIKFRYFDEQTAPSEAPRLLKERRAKNLLYLNLLS